jgi:hypothetical protein
MRPPPKETVEGTIPHYRDTHGLRAEADRTLPFADDREQGLHLCPAREALTLGSGQMRSIRDRSLNDELGLAHEHAVDTQLVSGMGRSVAHEVTSFSDDLEIVSPWRLR